MPSKAESNVKSRRPDDLPMYAALLRGINVGGRNKLPMRDLVSVFSDEGCINVRTYIQSGNVIFSAKPALAKRLPDLLTSRIAHRFAIRVPIIMRTADELRHVAATNPFLSSGADVKSLHVGFLAAAPAKLRVAALDPKRSPGDAFKLQGRDIFLHLPNGMAKTKLTNNYFDSVLDTISTFRNWRTVLTLAEMARSAG